MATPVIPSNIPPLGGAEEPEQTRIYLGAGTLVGVRLWSRRDRSAIQHWPRPELPSHWMDAAACTGERISFAIDALPAPQLVGRITLREVTEDSARLGIYLHPEQCGQGLGSAALLAFQRYIFREGLRGLTLDVAQDNSRAVRAYLRAGWHVTDSMYRNGFVYYEMQVHP